MQPLPPSTNLERLYDAAEEAVETPHLGDEFEERFAEAEALYHEVGDVDIGDWTERFYRREYRRSERGDRDAHLCNCRNPRCPLNRGSLPYQLRRRDSSVREDGREPTEVLRQFLKEHPGAVVIDDALDELEKKRQECAERFRRIKRDANERIEEKIDAGEVPEHYSRMIPG